MYILDFYLPSFVAEKCRIFPDLGVRKYSGGAIVELLFFYFGVVGLLVPEFLRLVLLFLCRVVLLAGGCKELVPPVFPAIACRRYKFFKVI